MLRSVIAATALAFGKGSEEAAEMPIATLQPQYANLKESAVPATNSSTDNFVFLQKFPLGGVNLFYHTEVLVCPRSGFSTEDQQYLDDKIKAIGSAGFLQIDDSWWTTKSANCVELGYGGALCKDECCGVPHGSNQMNYQLKERRAVITNADGKQKTLFVYGTGAFDGNTAWHNACDKKCWSNWAGSDYNPITNNCNTFTSTILSCVYGLSQKKPHLGPSDVVTVKGHCPSSQVDETEEAQELVGSQDMPIAELQPQYVGSQEPVLGNSSADNFVFLQKFPLGGVNLFYHTEVLVCPRTGFSADDQQFLDGKIKSIGSAGFLQIDDSWWTTKKANCVELGYGGALCKDECCGVPHGSAQMNYQLQERRAVIGNADGKQKTLFIYGTGAFDGNTAWHNACDAKCWSNWAGSDYNPITNNCNTFTSTVLYCVYGLSQKKPHLGASDLVTVKGHCPSTENVEVVV